MIIPITSFTTSLLVFLMLFLSMSVIRHRHDARISLGDQGDKGLERKMRAFGNFIEYVPMSLIILALMESQIGGSWRLWGMAIMLLIARFVHALSFYQSWGGRWHFRIRRLGMFLQLAFLVTGGIGLMIEGFLLM